MYVHIHVYVTFIIYTCLDTCIYMYMPPIPLVLNESGSKMAKVAPPNKHTPSKKTNIYQLSEVCLGGSKRKTTKMSVSLEKRSRRSEECLDSVQTAFSAPRQGHGNGMAMGACSDVGIQLIFLKTLSLCRWYKANNTHNRTMAFLFPDNPTHTHTLI